ncbi:MAG: UDP-3-O-(3-hydroxymyristoyl)glucosamine N-acyltransferase [Nitrospira sp.]|nr:UDP-3-O-(3-hydroxymyristoyl)glucosamine N-acyltransferase [Nitrospira sp.]MCW5787342.1 UDP-3-O-(3-hydroxymyristoyl)glucosamine N-acyltransferase [Nitrospira sp.]MDR4476904.1 UDP-3-O-(3-hydroxymyristoyl)glucosamine N-acyltransferase [Nitrospira sp.]
MSTARTRTPLTVRELHEYVGGELIGSPEATVTGVASLDQAGPQDLAFVTSERHLKSPQTATIGALLVGRRLVDCPCPQIVVDNPAYAFARAAQHFFARPTRVRGVAEGITRGDGVMIGADASIWPGVTLGDRVTIGTRVTLYPGVFIGDDSVIGDDCLLYPNVVVREGCRIGARVIIHSGTVIGSDGFGYVQYQGRHQKIPQLGGVVIEDDVELGANVTIDRATFGDTVIKRGSKIDNLVQVAHNVVVGEHNILVAQVGIAGSTTLGRYVMVGGQAGLADHLQIGDQVMIAAKSGVTRSLEPNQIVSGAPVMPHTTFLKAQAVIPQLPEIRQRVRELEERLAALEHTTKPATKPRKPRRK